MCMCTWYLRACMHYLDIKTVFLFFVSYDIAIYRNLSLIRDNGNKNREARKFV